jgi:RNA polymerase sigma-70 factor (ECF subfamily)
MNDSLPPKLLCAEFIRLYLAAEKDLFRYVCALLPRPQDARDVVQETAVALWEDFDRYDRTRPFVPWALGFALNMVRKHAEREGRKLLLLKDEILLEKITAEQQSQRPSLEARQLRLEHCLKKLSTTQANLVRGYYWDGLGVEALAAQTRSTVAAVYKRLQRIRALLLNCVQQLERYENQFGDRVIT